MSSTLGGAASAGSDAASGALSSASNATSGVTAEQIQSDVLGPMSVMSSGFSDSFASPLKAALPKTYSVGYSGAPRAFFNDLMTNSGQGLLECGGVAFSATDGTACAYAANLSLMVVIGVLIPVIAVIYCFFFACGRMMSRCECMCKPCGEPNCGSRKPTRVEYRRPRKILCCCCYTGFMLAVITIGLVGFLSTNQMATDVQDVLTSLDEATAFPDNYRAALLADLETVGANADAGLNGINDNLVGIPDIVETAYSSLNTTLSNLRASVTAMRAFVEGDLSDQSTPNPCTFAMNGTVVTFDPVAKAWTDNGTALPANSGTCCASGSIYSCVLGTHAVGKGSALSGENSRGAICNDYTVLSDKNVTVTPKVRGAGVVVWVPCRLLRGTHGACTGGSAHGRAFD